MISLAGTVGLVLTVIFLTKIAGSRKTLPIAAILLVALVEVVLVFFYMTTLEVPTP